MAKFARVFEIFSADWGCWCYFTDDRRPKISWKTNVNELSVPDYDNIKREFKKV